MAEDMADSTPFVDPAHPILANDPVLSDENRADLWDIFHNSKDPGELATKLQPLVVPDDTKNRLYQAKKLAMPPVAPIDQTTAAINKVAQIDPKVLDLAEAHPNVLKALTSAAVVKPEKPAGGPSGASSAAGKGKGAEAAQTPAPLVQPPRIDGQEHFPPIPDKHRRILASDGGIHDVPEENLDRARQLDPLLHVLNP